MQVKHVFAAIQMPLPDDPDQNFDILHLCAYGNPPTENDRAALIEELATDEEFGMIGMKEGVDYKLVKLKDEAVQRGIEAGVLPAEISEEEEPCESE
jgi:hypothetical protein